MATEQEKQPNPALDKEKAEGSRETVDQALEHQDEKDRERRQKDGPRR